MKQAITFSFENDLTLTLESGEGIGLPVVGERVEFADSDDRMITGIVERRSFRYDRESCTVVLYVGYR